MLLAVAAASAGQTAVLAFLPTLVDGGQADLALRIHDVHVASLTAAHPLAALVFAPLWGWLADRIDYRIILRTALVVLALATAPVGAVPLPMLYGLRLLAGLSAAAIIPLALLSTNFAPGGRDEQARRFTWLTAFMFLGDLFGPLLAEASASLFPRTPLLVLALVIAVLALALTTGIVRLPARCAARPEGRRLQAPPRVVTLVLLLVTIVGGGGLAAMHVSLLVTRSEGALSREAIAGMLSLCGLAMLAAQLFHTRVTWLVTAPRTPGLPHARASSPVAVSLSVWNDRGRNGRSHRRRRLELSQSSAGHELLDQRPHAALWSHAWAAAYSREPRPGAGAHVARRRVTPSASGRRRSDRLAVARSARASAGDMAPDGDTGPSSRGKGVTAPPRPRAASATRPASRQGVRP
ncbi:MFS transporter [Caulobacter sp. UC70_42]|uniref:MFS transporter n=1 Tax=Caulobacter sp. UC70_42 TaxID=3374551 RepID=UPI0037568B8B